MYAAFQKPLNANISKTKGDRASEPCCVPPNVMIAVRLMGLKRSVSHSEAEILAFKGTRYRARA